MFENARQWAVDALSLEQQPQTLDRRTSSGYVGGGVETVEPPDNLPALRDQVEETPLLKWPIFKFASDVSKHGVRIECESDETVDFFMGGDNAPEGTPDGGFLSQAAIEAGKKNKHFQPLIKNIVEEHESPGTAMIEHVRADPDNPNSPITGYKLIDALTVRPLVYEDQNLLIDPEDTDNEDTESTKRDEAAAYVQFDNSSPLGKVNRGGVRDKGEVLLSQNDITTLVRDPQPGDVFGTPVNYSISDRVTAFKEKLQDNERAIKTKAYGIWSVAFGREILTDHLDYTSDPDDGPILNEWSSEEQEQFINNDIQELGPGEVVGHDGLIDFEKFEGEIANGLLDFLEFDVKYILSQLTVPKYLTGFEDDVNRDVTSEQSPSYDDSVDDMRQKLERELTPMLRMAAEDRDLSTEGFKLKLEPEEDESPIRSLTDEEVNRFKTYAESLEKIENLTIVTEEEKRALLAQLPETPDLGTLEEEEQDEDDPAVQDQFGEMQARMSQLADQGEDPDPDPDQQAAVPDGGEEQDEADD